jgi:hypothetical protein
MIAWQQQEKTNETDDPLKAHLNHGDYRGVCR